MVATDPNQLQLPFFPSGQLYGIVLEKMKVPQKDTATHAKYHAEIKAYLRRRRRADAQYVPWKIRLARWIAAQKKHPEAHGRVMVG